MECGEPAAADQKALDWPSHEQVPFVAYGVASRPVWPRTTPMMHRLLCPWLALFATAPLLAGGNGPVLPQDPVGAPEAVPASDREAAEPQAPARDLARETAAATEHVERAAALLAKHGLPVDLAELSIAVRTREELKQLELARLQASLGPARADMYRRLLQSYGRQFASGEEYQLEVARRRVKGQIAHYRPRARELAVVWDDLAKLEQDRVGLLLPLAQAARHQAGSPLFEAASDESFDAMVTREAMTFGGALLDARRAAGEDSLKVGPGRWLRDLDLAGLDAHVGRSGYEAFEAVRSEEALAQLWSVRFPSSEQLLHVNKRGRDEPRRVELPAWPEKLGEVRTLHEDTLGEAGIEALLLELGSAGLRAEMASTGWDGDRIRHGVVTAEEGEGEHVLVWRTLWDRPKDAQAFAQEWRKRAGGQIAISDRTVDWVLSDSRLVWNRLLKDLQTRPFEGKLDDADAAGTLAAEELAYETRRSAPYVVANEWRHPRLGLTVVVPPGWYEYDDEELGQTYMVRTRTAGYRDNVHVTSRNILDGSTIAEVLEVNEKRLREDREHEFISAETRMLGDTEVGMIRYQRNEGGHEVIFTTLVILDDRRQIGVTMGVELQRWDKIQPVVEQILSDVRLGKVPPMSRN